MGIIMKLKRIDEIGQELEIIKKTLDTIRYLSGTVNVKTTERCLSIANHLSKRMDDLWKEFNQLAKEIDKLKEDNGL